MPYPLLWLYQITRFYSYSYYFYLLFIFILNLLIIIHFSFYYRNINQPRLIMGERRGTKALELWCRKCIEGYDNVRVDNMTTSWRNGLAFCALIHSFRPDLM